MQAEHNERNAAGVRSDASADRRIERLARSGDAPGGRGERGAAMGEYALLLAFVFVAAILAVTFFGETVVALFDFAPTALEDAATARQG